MCDLALHTVEIGLADAGRQAEDGSFQHPAHAVALGSGGTDGGFHGFFYALVQHRKALGLAGKGFHLCSQLCGIVQRKAGVRNAGTLRDMGGDVDARTVQCA